MGAELDLDKMQGIITFPSYHAGLCGGDLCGASDQRRALAEAGPDRSSRCGTIVATPVDGGHYFVDVLAGVCDLRSLSIMVAPAERALGRRAWPRLTASPSRR